MNLEKLLKVPYIEADSGFDLSPDGTRLAFAWNPNGQWEIYLLDLNADKPARQITHGNGAKFGPRWSPDGSRLAYLVDLDGGENYDIYCFDLASGEHNNLTPETPEAIQPGFSWSPDGGWIAFSSNREGHFSTYILPTSGGEHRLILDLPEPDWKTNWSPDGQWLAITIEAQGQDFETYLVRIDGGNPRLLSIMEGAAHAREVCWSPDAKELAFASDLFGTFRIGIYNLDTDSIEWLPEDQGNYESPTFSPDRERIAFVIQQGTSTSLGVCELKNKHLSQFQLELGIHYRPKFTPDGKNLLFIFENPARPADLWRLNLETGRFQQITFSLAPEFSREDFVIPGEVSYPGLDGRPVPALLYQPESNFKGPRPAVVYIHGGPNWLTRAVWDPAIQNMVSLGWVILAPNYRGSTGYGRSWQHANRFDLGGGDLQDIVAGADYLITKKLADPIRIALTGRSYGGYLTMCGLTQFPDRWASGSAVVPFLNWFTGHENSRKDLQHWDLENFGDPERDHDLYYQRSPFFFLDRVSAPVQLICGANDPRCPASESIQAKEALDARGKPCQLLLYPDEGHHFLKTKNILDAELQRAAFLANTLNENRPEGNPS